jgi:hypothetical protein
LNEQVESLEDKLDRTKRELKEKKDNDMQLTAEIEALKKVCFYFAMLL